MTSNETADTAEIKSEIARTRVEMSETIGEIQDRLNGVGVVRTKGWIYLGACRQKFLCAGQIR